MADTGDRKYILNAEMLGQMVIDGNGAYSQIKAADAIGLVDTELSSGINGANLIAAINSAYAAAAGNEPGGSQFAIQVNNGSGGFSGSLDASGNKLFSAQQNNTSGTVAVSLLGSHNVQGSSRLTGSFSVALPADPSTELISMAQSGATAGQLILVNELQADGGIDVNGSKFTVASATGNTTVAGTADVAGDFSVATTKLTVASATGNTGVAGTLDVTGDTSVTTFDSSGVTSLATGGGATSTGGALSVGNDFDVATNKFTVASGTGNTVVAGTLGVTGIATFTADPVFNGGDITNATTGNANNIFATSTGKTTLGGGAVDLSAAGAVTTVKGTLNVDQAVTLDAALDVTGDTSVSTFDSSGATSLATGGGVVAIASSGVMTTVKGTLNVDEAVTLDTTLGVTGIATFTAQSVHSDGATFNSAGLAACGAIAGATTIDASGQLSAGSISMTGFTVDADGDTSVKTLDVNSGGITEAGAISGASTIAATGLISTTSADGFKLRGTNSSNAPKNYQIQVIGGVLVATESAV